MKVRMESGGERSERERERCPLPRSLPRPSLSTPNFNVECVLSVWDTHTHFLPITSFHLFSPVQLSSSSFLLSAAKDSSSFRKIPLIFLWLPMMMNVSGGGGRRCYWRFSSSSQLVWSCQIAMCVFAVCFLCFRAPPSPLLFGQLCAVKLSAAAVQLEPL